MRRFFVRFNRSDSFVHTQSSADFTIITSGFEFSVHTVVERYYRDRDSLEPISRDELRARLRKGSVLVLDVRPTDEYAAGHLPGAISIPVSEIKRRLKEIPKSQDIVACCRGPYCVYSYEAIEILRPKGFRARRLDGGFSEWLAAGLPIERPRARNRN